ncbi:MAG: DUF362 domain-containing protein [Armatimonadota bacterium]
MNRGDFSGKDELPAASSEPKPDRRAFMRRVALGAAGLALGAADFTLARPTRADDGGKSDVVIVRNAGMCGRRANDFEKIQAAVDRALCELTGKATRAEAWAEIVKPEDVVLLKVNASAGRTLTTAPEVVDAVLVGITEAGVPQTNIIVADKTDRQLIAAGYAIRKGREEYRCMGLEEYEERAQKVGPVVTRFARTYTDEMTVLINMPVLKTSCGAPNAPGVTLALKNNFGAISNPSTFHHTRLDPYIAAVNSAPVIKDKTRLVLCDALRPLIDGGPNDNPRARVTYDGVIAAFDPVAHDRVGWQVLEELREKAVGRAMPVYPAPVHIQTAGARFGLGNHVDAQINRREVRIA